MAVFAHVYVSRTDAVRQSAKDIKTKVTRNGQTTKIVAYGADNCIKLAANRFFDPPYEPSNKATNNADSFAFIAAGKQRPV